MKHLFAILASSVTVTVFAAPASAFTIPELDEKIQVGSQFFYNRTTYDSEIDVIPGGNYKLVLKDATTGDIVTSIEGTNNTGETKTVKDKLKIAKSGTKVTVDAVVGDPVVTLSGSLEPNDLVLTYDFTGLNGLVPGITFKSIDLTFSGNYSLDVNIPSDPLSGPSFISRFDYLFEGFSSEPFAIQDSSGYVSFLGDFQIKSVGSPITSSFVFTSFDPLQGNWAVKMQEDLLTSAISLNGKSDGIREFIDKGGTVEEVPGPLPILGAAAAFGYSRKLRKSIKASKPEVISTTAV
jgi:hypothetical protein